VSFNLILQSRSNWSNATWQKRRKELDNRLSFENGETSIQMQQAVKQFHEIWQSDSEQYALMGSTGL